MKGYEFFDKFKVQITSIVSSKLDDKDIEYTVKITETPDDNDIKCKIFNDKELSYSKYIVGDNEMSSDGISILQDGKNLKLIISDTNNRFSNLLYLKINFEVTPVIDTTPGNTENPYVDDENISSNTGENKLQALSNKISESIVLIRDYTDLNDDQRKQYEKLLRNGFYVHGRAGIFDEINYFDERVDNEILPTKWYNKQEPFEFEFVVNTPAGMHKIFDNLILISNNVEPNSLEFEFIGDVYDFNKSGIYKSEHVDKNGY